jgi:uncharacterized delta-60 repeat protein
VGQNASFTVAAAGSGTLSYQWRRSGFPITGATSATFVQGHVTLFETGYYDVVVSDNAGSTRSDVAQLSVTPRASAGAIAPDPNCAVPLYNTSLGVAVREVVASSDGGFYAAGSFARVDDTLRSCVMHVNRDGELDSHFAPPEILGFWVDALALQADGKILIGGIINHLGDQQWTTVARLNPDGSPDTSFRPQQFVPTMISAILVQPDTRIIVAGQPGPALRRYNRDGSLDRTLGDTISGSVYGLALQPDGKIVVVGTLTATVNGRTLKGAVRINTDGSVDEGFDVGSLSGNLQTVAIGADNSIYIGRDNPYGSMESAVLRLKPNGAIDSTFSASVDISVRKIVEQASGKILIGGSFSYVNGIYHPHVARLTHNGALDVFATTAPTDPVEAIAELADQSVVVGSQYLTLTGPAHGPSRYDRNGNLAAAPNFTLRGRGGISAFTRVAGGKTIAFGIFDEAGSTQTENVVRLNADGSIDPTFANQEQQLSYNGIQDAVALPDGRIAIAGLFDSFMGRAHSGLALLNGDGTPDYRFNQADSFQVFGRTVALSPAGSIIVAGTSVYSGTSPGAIAAYRLDGSLDPSFAFSAAFNDMVKQIAVQRDGRVLVAGYFTTYNGAQVSPLVRLNANGTLDAAYTANVHFNDVYTMTLAPSGQLYVAGSWTGSNPVTGVVRLNTDGTRDQTFAPALAAPVYGMLLQPDGRLIVGERPGGTASPYMVRLNQDGTVDPTFRGVHIDPVPRIAGFSAMLKDDGQLLFLEGDGASNRLRVTTTAAAPVIITAPAMTTIPVGNSAVLEVAASSIIPVTYQWRFNGTAIPGATGSTYTIPHLTAATAGEYSVIISNELGSITTPAARVTAPLDTDGHIANLSIRAVTGTGGARLIVGVVLGGTDTGGDKAMLFRAVGPTLTDFHVPGVLADPMLELYDPTGFKVDQNDNWDGVFDFTSVGAFPFTGAAPKDAAIYNPYAGNGAQTMHVIAKPNDTGIALAEVYDATPSDAFTLTTPRIINGSARSTVGAGDNVLILGFSVVGNTSERVLIRAAGPTIGAPPFNVGGVLVDPMLEVYDATHTKLATNDNWGEADAEATMKTAFDSVGAFGFPSGSKDSAVIVTLAPGTYSAVVRGVGGTTGTAMVELYELP